MQTSLKSKIMSDVKNITEERTRRPFLPGDKALGVIVLMFFVISMIVVSSAVLKEGFMEGIADKMVRKHVLTLICSAVIIVVCYFIPASWMRWGTRVFYSVSWIATLIPYFLPPMANGAHRWLNLGFFAFQPSELLKIATIMLLASRLSARHQMIKSICLTPTTIDVRKWFTTSRQKYIIFEQVLPILTPIALTCLVILPDATSSAVHIFIVSLLMLFLSGVRIFEIFKVFVLSVAMGLLVIFTIGRGDTVVSRLKDYANSDELTRKERLEKDTYRSRMAIQNGGFFGEGAGRSVMRGRLMHPESDYIFAVIVEEFGLLVSMVIVMLYLWLFFRSLRIFEKCEWLYGGLLAVGMALLITSQAYLHIGVATGILPETGQNLPFLTQGRTGMFGASIAVGAILSISRQVESGELLPAQFNRKKDNAFLRWLWR